MRTHVIPVRFNDAELARMDRAAKKMKMSRAAWIRDMLSFLSSPNIVHVTLPEILPNGNLTVKKYTV